MLCIIIPSIWLPNTIYKCTVYAFCLNWGVRDYGDDHSDHANQIQPDIYQLHGVLQRRHKRLLYDTNNDRLSFGLTRSRSQRFASTTSAFQFGFRKLGGALRGRQTLRGGYYPRYPCIYRIAYHGITTWVFSYSGGSSPGIIHLLQTILHIRYSVLDTIPYFHRRE